MTTSLGQASKRSESMPFELINPAGLEPPVGYAHVAKITGGTVVHIAGQAPFDVNGQVVGKGDFVAQFTQVMSNLQDRDRSRRRQTESLRGADYLCDSTGSLLGQHQALRCRLSRGVRQIFSSDYVGRGQALVQSRLHVGDFRNRGDRLTRGCCRIFTARFDMFCARIRQNLLIPQASSSRFR